MEQSAPTSPVKPRRGLRPWAYDVLLLCVLLVGLLLRFSGADWGEYQYLHPDERFLVWVGSDIAPVESLSAYFDTANSSLNPHNRGHGLYVYGTLPMFLARYLVEWVYGHSGFQEMTNVGRALSAMADMLTVYLVYLFAGRVYDRRVGLLAAAFSALAVLQIQQAHFFTMETFVNLFIMLAMYFAVRAAGVTWAVDADEGSRLKKYFLHPGLRWSLGFGFALGCAVASKVNAVPAALLLPAGFALALWKSPAETRTRRVMHVLTYLAFGALVSLLVFRLFQPYAFSGPGFFGLQPNPQWVQNLVEQRVQAAGDQAYNPPSLQWARRPLWFSFQNLTLWGLGLPLGLLAWAGFLWSGWRMLRGERQHILLWGWTALYFTWQSLQFNPTMRYQFPIYPALTIFAAWAVMALCARGEQSQHPRTRWLRLAASLIGAGVLAATAIYALAFASIYSRPITRVEASRWIYQNVPGPLNVQIQTGDGLLNQPLSYPYDAIILPDQPYSAIFTAKESGLVSEVYLPHITDERLGSPVALTLALTAQPNGGQYLGSATMQIPTADEQLFTFFLDQSVWLEKDQVYYLLLSVPEQGSSTLDVCGPLTMWIQNGGVIVEQKLVAPAACTVRPGQPFSAPFIAQASGSVLQVLAEGVSNTSPRQAMQQSLHLTIGPTLGEQAEASLSADFSPLENGFGPGFTLPIEPPLPVEAGKTYQVTVALDTPDGALSLRGAGLAVEGEWDDGLPLRMDGYDGYGGIYPRSLEFQMYWDENDEKLARFLRIYQEAEYITISSSRQWGTLPRLAERFPLSTLHYRLLLGCPDERSIEWCYNVAQPGMFRGQLGYTLVEVFQSDPQLGPLRINDQFAEEAFTVYDHPKVFIFQKTETLDETQLRALFDPLDLKHVITVTPKGSPSYPATLTLPTERLAEQQEGGTWSELFDTNALHNRVQLVGVIVWYLSVALLGLLAYPLLRLALPGLADRGYPLARIAGMLIFSYLAWLGGSLRIPVTRLMLSLVLLGMLAFSAFLAYRQRAALHQEWRERRGYFLLVEGLALGLFIAFLLVRLGNPDLWHPYHGGEKPMDFSYFNAVLKSTTFPPYDPWYAGGYLNYYYYGFVFVGMLVKWLGIVPAIAYNLILPTLFSMVAMGAFSIAFNLRAAALEAGLAFRRGSAALRAGLAGAALMTLLGNLGSLRMIVRGYTMLGAPGLEIDALPLIDQIAGFFRGLAEVLLRGASLPYYPGDWYWIPSRAIAAPGEVEPITEFPLFTFLYADLHAHMIALPLALLALAWALSVVLAKARWPSPLGGVLSFLLGGLAIGVLYPTNLSDIYTYLPIGLAALGYGVWRYASSQQQPHLFHLSRLQRGIVFGGIAALLMALLTVLAFYLFEPYRAWYGQPYSKIILWHGTRTPLEDYLVHWGLFLFIIISWMTAETFAWMAHTPLSALRKVNWPAVGAALLLLLTLTVLLAVRLPDWPWTSQLPVGKGVQVAWLILPLMAWSGLLLLRPGMADARRVVLFWVGTGLAVTLMVEIVSVQGDIGRMNTVFKFYLHAWTLFAVSAAAALAWLWSGLRRWPAQLSVSWQVILAALLFSAGLFTLMATSAKINYRWHVAYPSQPSAPHTLDGMAYMDDASYFQSGLADAEGRWMSLAEDAAAIRWMQENIAGSPVILETPNNGRQYHWYTRYSIYTGLPGVVGWEWHQSQQRNLNPAEWVNARGQEMDQFYLTRDFDSAAQFLRKYDVSYIVVGQLERISYPSMSLQKFEDFEGRLWREVYRDGQTVIYEVIK